MGKKRYSIQEGQKQVGISAYKLFLLVEMASNIHEHGPTSSFLLEEEEEDGKETTKSFVYPTFN